MTDLSASLPTRSAQRGRQLPRLAAAAALALTFALTSCAELSTLLEAAEVSVAPSVTNETAPGAPQFADPGFTTLDVTASELLAALPVKGRAPKTGFDRDEQFGRAWIDVDLNGCDTRNDILLRDLTDTTVDDRCRVLTGVLNDPFTGERIDFVRGEHTSPRVQIDHVVALSDAWQKGAQALNHDARVRLANDPLNLIAVDGPTNAAKGDSDAASWLPPQRAFRCEYVARQVSVKAAYALWVTAAERDAIAAVLRECPGQPAYAAELAR